MTNIILISNDQRAQMLVNHFQPLLDSVIVTATDINKGLKEFFDKRPVVVFIQEELAGTTGEAVAKHIKTLLRHESPRLVLLRNSSAHYLLSQSSCDDFIPLPLPESELLEKFEEQLRKIPLIQWKKTVSAEMEAGAAEPEPRMETPACPGGLPADVYPCPEASYSSTAEKFDASKSRESSPPAGKFRKCLGRSDCVR
jgi:DNA-binding response OmpR family regulator